MEQGGVRKRSAPRLLCKPLRTPIKGVKKGGRRYNLRCYTAKHSKRSYYSFFLLFNIDKSKEEI